MIHLPHGPLMIDIAGTELCPLDRERLIHPLVGGIILFTRNYVDPQQLSALTEEIHALREPRLLIAVDHEGGRVQRFRDGFTQLPAMRRLGELYAKDRAAGRAAARYVGYVLASELRACGVDYAFTPVLDLDYGPSRVIGDRAFGRDSDVVIALAGDLVDGLRRAGMGACGKHFPGHGYVVPDSHVELPVDDRTLEAMREDIRPYRELALDGVMAAHVIYSCVDCNTAVFSNRWIEYLRNDIKFSGVVFTDDLSMAGAGVVGDMLARVGAAAAAGCDMMLICNSPDAVAQVLDQWEPQPNSGRAARIAGLLPNAPSCCRADLANDADYRAACSAIANLPA